MSINQNTELALINTTANAGSITLPSASLSQGRVINFKDSVGRFGTNTLTLNTSGSDTFEDGGTSKKLQENNGIIQIVASGTTWYVLTGTQENSVTVSTLQTLNVSSVSISSANLFVSSLQFSNIVPVYQQSSLVYFNSNVFAGTRVYPQTRLNSFRFSPYQLFGLSLWLDAGDTSSVITSGSNLTQWKDKSGNSRNLTTKSGTITYGAYQGLNCIQNTNNSYIYSLNPVDLTQFTFFIVCLSITNVTNQSVFCAIPQSNIYNSYNSFDSFGFFVDADIPRSRFYGSLLGNNVIDAATSSNSNSYPLRMMAYTETSNTVLNSFVNGNTGSTNSGTSTRSNTCQGFVLGANFNGTSPNGATSVSYTHEILVYNRVLITFQRQQMEGYLAWKWGLQANLPANHPFKNAPP